VDRPTREIIAQHLDYDPATGALRWRVKRRGVTFGGVAGTIVETLQGHRYRQVTLFRRRWMASRLIWVLMTGEWPPEQIDHRNRDSLDDRWSNLRAATRSQNQGNRGLIRGVQRQTTSGYKGVYCSKQQLRKRWIAQIRSKYIGCFFTAEEAARAYDIEARKLYGEFAALNFPREG